MAFFKKKKIIFIILTTLFLVFLDQGVKYLIPFSNIPMIINKGAGFGIFQGKVSFIVFLTLFIIIGIFFLYNYLRKISHFSSVTTKRHKNEKKNLSYYIKQPITLDAVFVLLLGGALGNFIDRITLGGVRDFIHVPFWPSFNLADACISIGSILAILIILLAEENDVGDTHGKKAKKRNKKNK